MMKMVMRKWSKLLFLATLLVVISSCTVAPITGRKQLSLVTEESVAAEAAIFYKEFINEAASKGALATNTAEGQRLRRIGNNMKTSVEQYLRENGMTKKLSTLDWEFNLIRSDTMNAFSTAGGKVAFYTGILPVLKNDAGIAYVMGHEIGHVIAGHIMEGTSQRILAGITQAITGVVAGNQIQSLVSDGLKITLLKFNRTQEYEADKYGMIFMAMAGYNPAEAIAAEERMTLELGGSSQPEILLTHPSGPHRIAALKKFLPEAMKYYSAR